MKNYLPLVIALFINFASAQESISCASSDEKNVRDFFEKASAEIHKRKGGCYDLSINKDIKFFASELASLSLIKGVACFQNTRTFIRINSPYTAELLLADGKAFHNSGIPGNKKFIFSSNVEETKFRDLSKTLEKLSSDKLTLWSEFRNNWNCKSVEKSETSVGFKFTPKKDSIIDQLIIYFSETSPDPQKLVLYGPGGLNVDIILSKTADTSSLLPIPDSLQPAAGYLIQKTN